MIVLKTARELQVMKYACEISAGALRLVGENIRPGVSTKELDELAFDYIKSKGCTPNFLGVDVGTGPYPATACISINAEVIHGIPDKRRILKEGDIVSVDLGAAFEGYNGDNARTFACGEISPDAKRLMEVTEQCLFAGIKAAVSGGRVGDISSAVQTLAEDAGVSVVQEVQGHGVGQKLHEAPDVPNFGRPGRGARLMPGMTIAIEPMINLGDAGIYVKPDGWTVVTSDGKPSAHYEHTIAITENGPVIMTVPPEE